MWKGLVASQPLTTVVVVSWLLTILWDALICVPSVLKRFVLKKIEVLIPDASRLNLNVCNACDCISG